MKDGFFQLRISKQDRAVLEALARHYNLSASAVVCMLIAERQRLVGDSLGGSEDEKKS